MAYLSQVDQVTDEGNPQPSYRLSWRDNAGGVACYMERDFGVGSAAAIKFESDFRMNVVGGQGSAGFIVARPDSGIGALVRVLGSSGAWTLSIGSTATFASISASIFKTQNLTALAADTWFRMIIDVTKNSDGTLTLAAEVFDETETTSYGSVTGTLDIELGGHCGFYGVAYSQLGGTSQAWFDNIRVRASGSTNATIVNFATSYVFTFVNDLGEESAPSPVSATILRPDGVAVTVTTPIGLPTGVSTEYGIESKRIYRAVTGATGSIFRFVAEITLGTADYVDTLSDDELGDELESEGWELPPDDLEGILALPNGVMVGYRRNQLCFSEQNRPHAWPVRYRLNTDTDIVAIGAIDSTVVVGTKSHPYVASGTTPADYVMAKLEVPQACVSKLGLAYLIGIGVVFPSPDGLIAVAGVGQVRNLTELVFTREQWQALNPETMRCVAHDDVLFLMHDAGTYAIDMRSNGFGIVQLGFIASAFFVDPLTDSLYLVLDEVDEPSSPYLLEPSTAPTPDGQTIYQFDGDDSSRMVYRFVTKPELLTRPGCPQFARIRAGDYENLLVRGIGDGDVHFEKLPTGGEVFTLPTDTAFEETYQFEILGTSRLRTVQAVETVEELR